MTQRTGKLSESMDQSAKRESMLSMGATGSLPLTKQTVYQMHSSRQENKASQKAGRISAFADTLHNFQDDSVENTVGDRSFKAEINNRDYMRLKNLGPKTVLESNNEDLQNNTGELRGSSPQARE